MRKIISLICLLLPTLAYAVQPESGTDIRLDIRSDAPDRHVVVKGDTLWDISGKFFNDPWKWPHIWGINKETIKNPHWIYPGDIVFLDRASGTLRISQTDTVVASPDSGTVPVTGKPDEVSISDTNTLRLSPRMRASQSDHDIIPSIPAKAITPFLSKPLVIEEEALQGAPMLIGAREGRVTLSSGDTGFVRNLPADQGDKWQIYRPGKTFIDPETDEVLGIEAVYLGNAEVSKFADVSTIAVTYSKQEIHSGDRLVVPSSEEIGTYLPRAPEGKIAAQVISIYGGVARGGQNTVITLSKGARDGLEVGHVLALYRKGEDVKVSSNSLLSWDKTYTLPDERYGLVFVFRVFDKVSYALVMQTKLPVQLLDHAHTP
ncbi:MAG: LysM peptidoglycan-binding domain-containing protein [Nitrosomonadales bacterium]|nr:LysM peptidoglycan-binding domain-containing protein [Nitrosomonadales bacterium]